MNYTIHYHVGYSGPMVYKYKHKKMLSEFFIQDELTGMYALKHQNNTHLPIVVKMSLNYFTIRHQGSGSYKNIHEWLSLITSLNLTMGRPCKLTI